MFPLVNGLPDSISVDGESFHINTSFRYGINVSSILDDPNLLPEQKATLILNQYFYNQDKAPRICDEAFSACMDFHTANRFDAFDRSKSGVRNNQRCFDWEYDEFAVVADFQREYGIDLYTADLHWWRFMALFRGLSDTSQTISLMTNRTRTLPGDASAEAKRALAKTKAAIALPPRTREEAIAAEEAMLGM